MKLLTRPLGILLLSVSTPLMAADEVFFSEYIEGSGNNKALEIANLTGADVDLSQYSIQMFFNGRSTAGNTIQLNGIVKSGDVFVLANSRANSSILAEADQTESSGWFNGDDAIALLKNDTIIDSIGQRGFDPGRQWGSGDTSTQNNTLRRKLPAVLDSNIDDAFNPADQWEGFPNNDSSDLGRIANNGGGNANELVCGDPATMIHTIQGDAAASPLVGQTVTVEAVVTNTFLANGQLNGFFIQEEDDQHDNKPQTSEGVFVYAPELSTTINSGDVIRIEAEVDEFYQQTQLKKIKQIKVCSSNAQVSATSISLPFASSDSAEAYEGMLVEFSHPLTVSENYNLGRYGELVLSNGRLFNPTEITQPGAAANAQQAQNDLNRIILDDASTQQNPAIIPYPSGNLSAYNTVRSGDTVAQLRGVMSYGFGKYRIQTSETVDFTASNPRTEAPAIADAQLRVASFNVLNYFNGDGQGAGFPTPRGADTLVEFERQKAKIVSALLAMNADIVGLMEIENDGFDENSAIADLVVALNKATKRNYQFAKPNANQVGNDAIAVGLIYDSNTVTAEGVAKTLDSAAFTDKNRQPLLQVFSSNANKGRFSVVVNHFKSKSSRNCPDTGVDADKKDGQACWNGIRTQAAVELSNWLAQHVEQVNDPDVLILGDLNAYSMEQPVTTLEQNGYRNLIKQFNTSPQYTYVFYGQAGSLDHALANSSLARQIVDAKTWAINTDEPKVLDYNMEYKTPEQQQNYYADFAYRASDHDPVLVALNLEGETVAPVTDVNQDGTVDAQDLYFIFLNLAKAITPENQAADVNRDGKIDFADIAAWFKAIFAAIFAPKK